MVGLLLCVMNAADLPVVNRILRAAYARHDAPIIDLIRAQGSDPFQILVATLLSARTQDGTTATVVRRLFAEVKQASDFRRYTLKEIEALIFPVGFFRTKARHLRQLPDVLDARFGGQIPATLDALCELPGVGRKTANLVLINAFDQYGMCVDIHVHRISNRLGLVKTRTPHETEFALRELLPKSYWKTWNRHLVSFGQTQCRPVNPKCATCPLTAHCARVGIPSPRLEHPLPQKPRHPLRVTLTTASKAKNRLSPQYG